MHRIEFEGNDILTNCILEQQWVKTHDGLTRRVALYGPMYTSWSVLVSPSMSCHSLTPHSWVVVAPAASIH